MIIIVKNRVRKPINRVILDPGFESLVEYKWVQKCYNVQEYLDEKRSLGQENCITSENKGPL